MNTILIGIIVGIVLVFFLSLIKKDDKLAHLGINLSRIYCPNCNEKQPIVRKPNSQRQALYGGHTCRKCGTEMDKYGEEIIE
ncbi:hypothetical protein [uncultured Algibacter sp.]|uniref:hypothetical protein n=1 Tax=uncultured Algibacter sp. TaxID=298659 RepID=UPI00260A42EF|nr:hypothetical protein [uncultured Algibacter sp.]